MSRAASKRSGVIISTGGGVVTREENIPLLRQNGKLIYLEISPDELPVTPDRPLSASREAIEALLSRRHPLYMNAADKAVAVTHKNQPNDTANEILKLFTELI